MRRIILGVIVLLSIIFCLACGKKTTSTETKDKLAVQQVVPNDMIEVIPLHAEEKAFYTYEEAIEQYNNYNNKGKYDLNDYYAIARVEILNTDGYTWSYPFGDIALSSVNVTVKEIYYEVDNYDKLKKDDVVTAKYLGCWLSQKDGRSVGYSLKNSIPITNFGAEYIVILLGDEQPSIYPITLPLIDENDIEKTKNIKGFNNIVSEDILKEAQKTKDNLLKGDKNE